MFSGEVAHTSSSAATDSYRSFRTHNNIANTIGHDSGYFATSTNDDPTSDDVGFPGLNEPRTERVLTMTTDNASGPGSGSPKRKRSDYGFAEDYVGLSKKVRYEDDARPGDNEPTATLSIVKNFKRLTINTDSGVRSNGKRKRGEVCVDELSVLMKRCKLEDARPVAVSRKTRKTSWASIDNQGWDYKTGALHGTYFFEHLSRRR